MFGWLRRKKRALSPEDRWVVRLNDETIEVRDDKGVLRVLAKEALRGIAIETNDTGPWGADVWWLLFDDSDSLACAFPQGATGEYEAIAYFMTLQSFDLQAMTLAMTCTLNEVFPVWRKAS